MPPDMPSPTISPLRIGTRGSRLALAQTEMAAVQLRAMGIAVEIQIVKTSGDRIRHKPLAEFGGKALFAKELEEALLDGTIDLAVHSLKDLPAALPGGLALTAVLSRGTPFDALVLPVGASALADAPKVGTCSVRRAAQARRGLHADIAPLRGNVDTRLNKLDEGAFDALILSAAGLTRLNLAHRIGPILRGEAWLPALGQGAIGIETRQDDTATNALVERLDDPPSRLAALCERAFQAGLEGNCHSPIAGLAEVRDNLLTFRGEVLAPDGTDAVKTAFEVPLCGDAPADRVRVAQRAKAAGSALRPQAIAWL